MATLNMQKIKCVVPSCDKERRTQGYCMKHKNRLDRGLPLDPFWLGGRSPSTLGCQIEGCEREHYAREYCRFHHARWFNGDTDIARPMGKTDPSKIKPKIILECSFDPCDRDANSNGLCTTHWQQRYNGKELTPIKQYRKRAGGWKDDKGQECRTCFEYKEYENYYFRKGNQTYQTQCKKCAVAKAAIKQWESDKGKYKVPEWAIEYLEAIDAKSDSTKVS